MKTDKCTWTQDEEGDYMTECKNEVVSYGDTLAETGWKWCPFCGREIWEEK